MLKMRFGASSTKSFAQCPTLSATFNKWRPTAFRPEPTFLAPFDTVEATDLIPPQTFPQKPP